MQTPPSRLGGQGVVDVNPLPSPRTATLPASKRSGRRSPTKFSPPALSTSIETGETHEAPASCSALRIPADEQDTRQLQCVQKHAGVPGLQGLQDQGLPLLLRPRRSGGHLEWQEQLQRRHLPLRPLITIDGRFGAKSGLVAIVTMHYSCPSLIHHEQFVVNERRFYF